MTNLNEKQRRFCHEYVKDLNATQAAIRAGYSAKTAHSSGPRLLEHAGVMQEIAKLSGQHLKKLDLSAEKTLQAIARIAYGDIRGMFNEDGSLKLPKDWDDETAAAVAGMDVVTVSAGKDSAGNYMVERVAKIKRSDQLRALDMLARHHSLYNDTLEVNVTEDLAVRMRRAKGRKK